MSTIDKNAEALSAVSARGAVALRDLAKTASDLQTENTQLRAKVASYERADRVRDLATMMEERGLSPELTHSEKIASISKYEDLALIEHSIKLAGSGKLDLPRITDAPGTPVTDAGTASFLNFCVTGQGN